MNDNIDPDKAFLDGIKLALLRHCLMNRSEEKFMRKVTEGLLKVFENPTEQKIKLTYAEIIENLEIVINTKIDRLLKFNKLMKSTGGKTKTYDKINNFQTRAKSVILDLKKFNFISKDVDIQKQILKELGTNDPLMKGFELMSDLDKFNDEIIEITEYQIGTILTASHNSMSGLKDVLVENHCMQIEETKS